MERLQRLIASLMNRVRVNTVQAATVDGAPVFVKRRRFGGGLAIWLGNRFLKRADSGICMFVRPAEWLDWELYCARLLDPERREVKPGPDQSLIVPAIRGSSLRQLVVRGQALDAAFRAAALELRRVHTLECSRYEAYWSHGDLHLDNILYDAEADRAHLIDFDTRHEFSRDQILRHSDDLRVLLLELIATLDDHWAQPATRFLEEYREHAVLEELARQLFIPHGFARLFWFTRTNSCPLKQIRPRVQMLRELVQQVVSKPPSVGSMESSEKVSVENDCERRAVRNRA